MPYILWKYILYHIEIQIRYSDILRILIKHSVRWTLGHPDDWEMLVREQCPQKRLGYVVDVSNTVEIQPLGYHDRNTSQGDVISVFVGNFVQNRIKQSPTIWAKLNITSSSSNFPDSCSFPFNPQNAMPSHRVSHSIFQDPHIIEGHTRVHLKEQWGWQNSLWLAQITGEKSEYENLSGRSWEIWYFLRTSWKIKKCQLICITEVGVMCCDVSTVKLLCLKATHAWFWWHLLEHFQLRRILSNQISKEQYHYMIWKGWFGWYSFEVQDEICSLKGV